MYLNQLRWHNKHLYCGWVFMFGGGGDVSDYKFLLIRVVSGVVGCMLLLIYVAFDAGDAHAYSLDYGDISNSYSGCNYRDNGNGTSTISTTIDFKPARGGVNTRFMYRGILLYIYDKSGAVINSSAAKVVELNGVGTTSYFLGENYSLYYSASGSWGNEFGFSGVVSVIMPNEVLSAWPALSIRAGAYTSGNDLAEIKGGAYITRDRNGNGDRSCRVIIDPGKPPAVDISISVSAPDWSLGDLQQGLSDTLLNRTDQQLCFSYDAADFKGKFIVGASNAGGVVNNRYQLRHLSDTSQVVPYSLTLDSGSARIQLPDNSTAISLNNSGRTCFVPTFRTEVGKTVKEGDYSDVLTFTITAKS